MFLLLRIAVVVAIIFYWSPARRPAAVDAAAVAAQRAEELSRLWGALPEPVRQQALRNAVDELRSRLGQPARPRTPGP
jgi:acyl-CoA reductase-like NAD-dependent aldehyde dehydrogenase